MFSDERLSLLTELCFVPDSPVTEQRGKTCEVYFTTVFVYHEMFGVNIWAKNVSNVACQILFV